MARTTKIPCEGVIYTIHEDTYGTIIETDEAVETSLNDEIETDERALYAQMLAELDEMEDALTQAEEQAARAEQLNTSAADENDAFPLF